MRKKIGFLIIMFGIFIPKMVFANTTATTAGVTKASPIQFESDEYLRITQPIKDKMAVFDKDVNVMGEARYKTLITMQLFNKREGEKAYPRSAYGVYDLDAVGISQTFSELIELQEGDNKIRFVYTYKDGQGEVVDGRFVIYVTRKTEEEKATLKNLRIDNTEQFRNGSSGVPVTPTIPATKNK